MISSSVFTGFTDADFDAYAQKKWSSNLFNRERLQVKQKLEALGCLVAPSLIGKNGQPLAFEVSAEHPALWNNHKVENQTLFFSRNDQEKRELSTLINKKRTMASLIEDPSPFKNHIFLAIRIDVTSLELCLKLHANAAVDRENLVEKAREYFEREKLLHLIRQLGDRFLVGRGDDSDCVAAQLTDDNLQSLIIHSGNGDEWFSIRSTYPSSEPILHTENFSELACTQLQQLLPIMNFVGWARNNDYSETKQKLQVAETKQRTKGISKGDVVRIVHGVFAGKKGEVQETDAKGALKVTVGKMTVRLNANDVVGA